MCRIRFKHIDLKCQTFSLIIISGLKDLVIKVSVQRKNGNHLNNSISEMIGIHFQAVIFIQVQILSHKIGIKHV